MPWQKVCPMDEKVRLVAALVAAEHSMTELCESFRISRKTAYKWWLRYQEYGPQGLLELSRATASSAVGDLGRPGREHPCAAPCASELGTQEVARQAFATLAAGELARAEQHRPTSAPSWINPNA
jgi:transposase-like protein